MEKLVSDLFNKDIINLLSKRLTKKELLESFSYSKNDDKQIILDRLLHIIQINLIQDKFNNQEKIILIKYLARKNEKLIWDTLEYILEEKNKDYFKIVFEIFLNLEPIKNKINKTPNFSKKIKLYQTFFAIKTKYLSLKSKKLNLKSYSESLILLDKEILEKLTVTPISEMSEKIDKLKANIRISLLKNRIKLIKKQSDKNIKPYLEKLIQSYKASLQKEIKIMQGKIQKVNVQISTAQNSIIISASKIKNNDLNKSLQIIIKANNFIFSTSDKMQRELDDYLLTKDKSNQIKLLEMIKKNYHNIIDKINETSKFAKYINKNISPKINLELKRLLKYYQVIYKLLDSIRELQKYQKKDFQSIISFSKHLQERKNKLNSFYINSSDNLNYIDIKTYLVNSLSYNYPCNININSKSGLGSSIYNISNYDFIGEVSLIIKKIKYKKLALIIKGNIINQNQLKKSYKFEFENIDAMVQFILKGFKRLDLFNHIPDIVITEN